MRTITALYLGLAAFIGDAYWNYARRPRPKYHTTRMPRWRQEQYIARAQEKRRRRNERRWDENALRIWRTFFRLKARKDSRAIHPLSPGGWR